MNNLNSIAYNLINQKRLKSQFTTELQSLNIQSLTNQVNDLFHLSVNSFETLKEKVFPE